MNWSSSWNKNKFNGIRNWVAIHQHNDSQACPVFYISNFSLYIYLLSLFLHVLGQCKYENGNYRVGRENVARFSFLYVKSSEKDRECVIIFGATSLTKLVTTGHAMWRAKKEWQSTTGVGYSWYMKWRTRGAHWKQEGALPLLFNSPDCFMRKCNH